MTVLIGFRGYVVILSCNGEFNIRDNAVLGSLDNTETALVQRIVELDLGCLAVFNIDSLSGLSNIFIRRHFGDRIGAGNKTRKDQLTIVIGFGCLLVIIACDGEFNTADVAVLGSLYDFQMTRAGFQLKNGRHGIGSLQTDDNVLLEGIAESNEHGVV